MAMKPYLPKNYPYQKLTGRGIAKANGDLARFDGVMQTIPNPVLAPIMT